MVPGDSKNRSKIESWRPWGPGGCLGDLGGTPPGEKAAEKVSRVMEKRVQRTRFSVKIRASDALAETLLGDTISVQTHDRGGLGEAVWKNPCTGGKS